jgi:tyrosyl-tRNA synthetase
MQDIFEDLKFRGLIYQVTNEKGLKEKLKKEKIVLYCGFDPTAPSFHLGNLVPILTLRRFQIFGHKPIALIGGGTALIGDPSGKTKERILNPVEKIREWKEKLKKQFEKFLDFETKENPAKILDNFEWLSKIDLISFLRDYGKHFQVAEMISKESVKNRISTTGISFCEFSYMVLQAIDFLKLYEMEKCELQIGGSDQWGNIVCGVDLIKKTKGVEVFGLTLPLLLTKSGKKFGKTEKGAIFLDKNLTPVYQFYQYLINTDDSDVIQLLKYFTFLSKEEVEEIEKEMKEKPKERKAQKILASELTKMVHGMEELKRVERISELLFYGKIKELKEWEIKEALFDVPTKKITFQKEISILDLLKEGGVAKSKTEAKRLIQQKGIEVNEELVEDKERKFSRKDALYNKYFVIKKGKKNYFLVELA